MHTPLCKHARGEPEEYAATAERRGLKGIVFTCHSPMPGGFWPRVRMSIEELDTYVEIIDRARREFEGRVDVRLGIESDYFPGMEEWLVDLHGRADFHHVLGSVHYFAPEYTELFWRGDDFEFQKTYFKHLADSAESGLFDTLSHPDLVKNAAPDLWDFERIQPFIADALDRIAKAGTAMELNTSGLNKGIPEVNPGPLMLRMMCERQIPVVIGSDSHVPRRVGANFEHALDLLEAVGYATVSFFNDRKRQELPIDTVRTSLR
jgi:histidinol-phosphatase (PHP family)